MDKWFFLDVMILGGTVCFLLQIAFFLFIYFFPLLFLVLCGVVVCWVFLPTAFYIFYIRIHASGDVHTWDSVGIASITDKRKCRT